MAATWMTLDELEEADMRWEYKGISSRTRLVMWDYNNQTIDISLLGSVLACILLWWFNLLQGHATGADEFHMCNGDWSRDQEDEPSSSYCV
eukprot:scaffold305250_cov77-Attheya_sp.AAC.1